MHYQNSFNVLNPAEANSKAAANLAHIKAQDCSEQYVNALKMIFKY